LFRDFQLTEITFLFKSAFRIPQSKIVPERGFRSGTKYASLGFDGIGPVQTQPEMWPISDKRVLVFGFNLGFFFLW
jgi:hypothetical protein